MPISDFGVRNSGIQIRCLNKNNFITFGTPFKVVRRKGKIIIYTNIQDE